MYPLYVQRSPIFSRLRCRYPTSGMARFITSPSVWTRKLITPWVLGCCGPMLSSMSPLISMRRRTSLFSMSIVGTSRGLLTAAAPEVVDDLDLVPLRPVDGGEVHQAVEGQGLVLLRVPADLHDVRRVHHEERVLVRGGKCANALTELAGETLLNLFERHLGGHLVVDAQGGLTLADLLARAEPPLADDLVLHPHQAFGQRLGTGRAAGYVDVHRHELVDALADRVGVLEEAAAGGAGAHGDDVLRLGHLLVEQAAALGHLVGQGSGDDHQVALARRRPGDGSESVDVRPRTAGLHQLDPAAGEPEEQVENAALARQVDDLVDERGLAGDDGTEVLLVIPGHLYAAFFSSLPWRGFCFWSRIDCSTSCFSPFTHSRSPMAHT